MIIDYTEDGETHRLITSGSDKTAEEVLEDRGVDPSAVEYSVERPIGHRVADLEAASGVGSMGPKKGIAHRIDDLEERIEALEDGT